jgi:DNA-binding NtrC family response regulator
MTLKLLIVDDNVDILKIVSEAMSTQGYQVDTSLKVKDARTRLDETPYDVLITDKNMPEADGAPEGGMSLLRYARRTHPGTEVIVMTGYASIETVVEALRLGAFDYIIKPFTLAHLREKIDRIREYKSFINPKNIIQTYKSIQNQILGLLQDKNRLTDAQIGEKMDAIYTAMDHFFRAQKQWERVLLVQKEALGKISGYAEQLRDTLSVSDPGRELVEQICQESCNRF